MQLLAETWNNMAAQCEHGLINLQEEEDNSLADTNETNCYCQKEEHKNKQTYSQQKKKTVFVASWEFQCGF